MKIVSSTEFDIALSRSISLERKYPISAIQFVWTLPIRTRNYVTVDDSILEIREMEK